MNVKYACIAVAVLFAFPAHSTSESRRQAAAESPLSATPEVDTTPAWMLRAFDLIARVDSGEIPVIEGSTSRTAPVYGDEWSLNDTLALEKNQTWWIQDTPNVGSIFIHLKNQTAMDLSGAALEYQGRPCNERAAVNNFYLTLTKPIPPGAQAVVNLKTDFPIETKGTTCLVIKRAWK